MGFFGCKHQWVVEDTSYTLPIPGAKMSNVLPDAIRRITEGVTHVYSKCTKCGLRNEDDFYGEYKPEIGK